MMDRQSDAVDIILLGFGRVGREFAGQVAGVPLAEGRGSACMRLLAVMDRTGLAFDRNGLAPKHIAALVAAKHDGKSLDQVAAWQPSALDALRLLAAHGLSRPILVDVTAGNTAMLLHAAIDYGMDLVLANKKPLADTKSLADALAEHAAARGRRVLYGATVGGGLPIVDTVGKLLESGDKILRIEGCASGTMGYLFGELDRGRRFSEALRDAIRCGYTEPDPREDLSGMDMARKALILGRLLGYGGDLRDVGVESLVPDELQEVGLDDFLSRLGECDAAWGRRGMAARARNAVLRYRMTVTRRRVRVDLAAVDATSPLGGLRGTDNQFVFTTARYSANPLVITGPGAGPGITAAGVLSDVLKLARMRDPRREEPSCV